MFTRRFAYTIVTHLAVLSFVSLEAVALPRGVNSPPLIDPHTHPALAAAWTYGVFALALAVAAQVATLVPSAFRKFKPGDTETLHFASTQCLAFAFVAFRVGALPHG